MIVQLLLMVLVVLFLKVDWLNKFLETLWPFLDKVSILRQVNVLIACKGLPSSLKILNFYFRLSVILQRKSQSQSLQRILQNIRLIQLNLKH